MDFISVLGCRNIVLRPSGRQYLGLKLTFSGAGKAAILRSANEENNVVDIVCDVGLVIGVESNLLSNNIIDQYKSRYSPAQSS